MRRAALAGRARATIAIPHADEVRGSVTLPMRARYAIGDSLDAAGRVVTADYAR